MYPQCKVQVSSDSQRRHYTFRTGKVDNFALLGLPFGPSNLQQLTIRATAHVENDRNKDRTPIHCLSCLPAADESANLFSSSPRHLILDIYISLFGIPSNLKSTFPPSH